MTPPGKRSSARAGARYLVGPAVALLIASAAGLAGLDATAAPVRTSSPYASGAEAIERLGVRLPDVAAVHGLEAEALRAALLSDHTLAVDRFGSLAYFEDRAPGEPVDGSVDVTSDSTVDDTAEAPSTTGSEFQLASLPGADLTIHLDFDGHSTSDTRWNSQYGIATIVSPPFDRDGKPDTWSSTELQIIRDAWAIVAEDFAPWQVNVTTADPGPEALRYSGSGDTQWGVRALVTSDTFSGCGCGGFAYIGAFSYSQDEPVFVFNSTLVGVAEAVSHEVGHALRLAHDGTTEASYYTGHDGTGPGWAPVMGASYYEEVSHWSAQEYLNANNVDGNANYGLGPDDIGIMSNRSLGNPPLRPDDHGGAGAPTALVGSTPVVTGIIGTRDDVDAFSFSSGGGVVTLVADGTAIAPNLDISMRLRNDGGTVVASSNPVDGMDASIAATVPAGTYLVEIDGVGVGSPFASPPSGYSHYGSLGQYTLSADIESTEPADTTAPAAPSGLEGTESGGDVALSWTANGESDLAGYVVQRDSGTGFVDAATVTSPAATDLGPAPGDHAYRVLAVDTSQNRSVPSDAVVVTVADVVGSYATAETSIAGSPSGTLDATTARGGAVLTITEATSSGKLTSRHDLLEHRWILPATTGGHTLTIYAGTVDGGDADDGVRFDVSDDGTTWTPVAHVPAGGSTTTHIDIGQRSGDVHVRVVDTDRSIGEHGPDAVAVDFLRLVGDGIVVTPPHPQSVIASLVTSRTAAAKGEQYGSATVTVTDDGGEPVSGAEVEVWFSGAFQDRTTGTTDASGTVTFVTTTSARKPSFSTCVASVIAPLPYVAGAEGC